MPRGLNPERQQQASAAGATAKPKGPGVLTGVNNPAMPSGGLIGGAFNAGAAAGKGAGTGVRRLTTEDIRTMQANQAAQLGAALIGPFTPEAVAAGYNSTVAGLYGVNYPKAQQFVALAQRNRWDQATFERWLRARPEFASTSVGQKMHADAALVMAQVFGVI